MENRLYLTNVWITILFIYYFLILIMGLFIAVIAIIPTIYFTETLPILWLSLIGSAGMALNGSSIFYTRKLYKLCFSKKLCQDKTSIPYSSRLGTIVYFIARPLFSLGFALLIVIGLQTGFMLTSSNPIEFNAGYVYLTMFFSFFVGFLTGRFINKLENTGDKVLDKLI